jgi:hypothetical protein
MFESTTLIAFRWIARILAVASVFLLLLFVFGEPPGSSNLTLGELVLFIFFPLGLIFGLVLGLFRELAGGFIAVVSVVCFYLLMTVVHHDWPGWWFLVFAIPGFLFILVGLSKRS